MEKSINNFDIDKIFWEALKVKGIYQVYQKKVYLSYKLISKIELWL